MNIPQKAFEAVIEAIIYDGRGYREARKDAALALQASTSFIQAQVLRDAAEDVLGPSPDFRDAATCRSIAGELRGRADELEGKL